MKGCAGSYPMGPLWRAHLFSSLLNGLAEQGTSLTPNPAQPYQTGYYRGGPLQLQMTTLPLAARQKFSLSWLFNIFPSPFRQVIPKFYDPGNLEPSQSLLAVSDELFFGQTLTFFPHHQGRRRFSPFLVGGSNHRYFNTADENKSHPYLDRTYIFPTTDNDIFLPVHNFDVSILIDVAMSPCKAIPPQWISSSLPEPPVFVDDRVSS